MKRVLILLSLLTTLPSQIFSQCQTLNFTNPSFEGTPAPHQLPTGWSNCNGTTSDTQPGSWGVTLPPTNGSTYIGLVAATGWQETASQFLSGCMVAGQTYTFSFDWYTFDETSTPGNCQGYLYVYGGSLTSGGSACDFSQVLWQSALLPAQTPGWQTQTISITPTQNWCSLTFQAVEFNCPSSTFYILIDNLTPVTSGLSINPTVNNSTSCNGNGSINLNIVGATGATTFAWTPNVSTTNSATNLAPGNYSVTVTDAAGCTATGNYTITGPPAMTASITNPSPNICAGATVNLTSTVTGGGGTNTFSWAPGGQTTANISVTPAVTTNYTLTVTDQFGCTTTATTTINVGTGVPVTAGSNSPLCIGSTLNLTVTTVAGATYSWTGPNAFSSTAQNPSIPAVTVAASGTYTVTVDQGGCISTSTLNVLVNSTFNAAINPVGPFCASNANVMLAAADAGGTWSGTGIVNASTGEFSPSVAGAGTFNITYSIPGACGDTQSTIIQIFPDADATILPAGPFCLSDPALNLSSLQTGGVWSGTGITNTANGTFNPATAGVGVHNITYTISGVCGDTDNINITINSLANSTITPVGPFCVNANPINLSAVTNGGTWSGTGITNSVTGAFSPAVAGAGTHTITYTIGGACGSSSTTNIVVNSLPTVSVIANNLSGCIPLTTTFTNTGSTGTSCNWLIDGNLVSSASCTDYTTTFNLPGCYDVTLQTTDANGCANSATVVDIVCVVPNPIADFTWSPTNATVLNPTIDFANASVGAATYLWNFDGLGTSTQVNPSFTFPDASAGSYTVCLNVASIDGCLDSVCKIITIYDEFLIYVPNAFTPDGDGKNDFFMPVVSGFDPNKFEFLIFDRWGELIFSSNSPDQKWDGMHRGQKAKQDVYVWKLKAKRSSDGERVVYYGHVSLLR